MTARRPGRPVSEGSRRAAIEAAVTLLDERGWSGFSVDEVARRSGVGKATIYKHWAGGFDLAVAAYGEHVTDVVRVRSTGDAVADLQDQLVRLARFYATPAGEVVTQLLGAAAGDAERAALVRERFFAARRSATVALIVDGQARGAIRPDLPPELVVDMVFGAVVFRLVNGEGALRPAQARQIAAAMGHALRPA